MAFIGRENRLSANYAIYTKGNNQERQASPYPNTERQASRLLKPAGLFYPAVRC
jgi:hypothetical protein